MEGSTPQKQHADARRMVRAELMGQHTHETADGIHVHVWRRNDSFLARGRHQGRPFGKVLGKDEREAGARLRRLLGDLEAGCFVRPSEAAKQLIKTGVQARLRIRELCDVFLREKRRLRGLQTAADYRNRLEPLIEFAEAPEVLKRWPLVQSVDHEFALSFRAFLQTRKVRPNGRASGTTRLISQRQVFNILDSVRTLFHWAKEPRHNSMPAGLENPFTNEIVGDKPRKDPLRPNPIPLEARIGLVQHMDLWELTHLSGALVLPFRPEEWSLVLVSDVDFGSCTIHCGNRFGGKVFNKGKQEFQVPFPNELAPLFMECKGLRADGPLLTSREFFLGERVPKLVARSTDEVAAFLEDAIARVDPDELEAPQDVKRLCMRVLQRMGALSPDAASRAFKSVCARTGMPLIKLKDCREAVTTELDRAGVSPWTQKYVTGHSPRDIMYSYVSLDLHTDVQKYFRQIQLLLTAIARRASALGIPTACLPHCDDDATIR